MFIVQYLLFACVRFGRDSRASLPQLWLTICCDRTQHATNATAQSLQGARFIQCAWSPVSLPDFDDAHSQAHLQRFHSLAARRQLCVTSQCRFRVGKIFGSRLSELIVIRFFS